MLKGLPTYESVPLEYRVALDAACVWVSHFPPIKVICDQPALIGELSQRLPIISEGPWLSGLWLEPQPNSWVSAMEEFSGQLSSGSRLAILISLPPARRLPECRDWSGTPLGQKLGGKEELYRNLSKHRFTINSSCGLHSIQAVLLNTIALYLWKTSRFAWAERVEFAARKRYIQPLSRSWYATCALVLATKK